MSEVPHFTEDGPERDAWFTPGNDDLWGEGNWIKCDRCLDSVGLPAYHHRRHHITDEHHGDFDKWPVSS